MDVTNQYVFVLGKNHTLSKLEILAVLSRQRVHCSILSASQSVLILQLSQEIDAKGFLKELGGTVKIAKVLLRTPLPLFPKDFLKELAQAKTILSFFPTVQDHDDVKFGVSAYHVGGKIDAFSGFLKDLPVICKGIKGVLQQTFKRVTFPVAKGGELSGASIVQNDLLDKGCEFMLCLGDSDVVIAKTVALQEFEEYSKRDYGRPERDAVSGMIPPKLAKMMANLAGKEKTSVVVDPFCGSGTIVQELVLLGYTEVIGTDASGKSIAQTKSNLSWLFRHDRDVKKKKGRIEFAQCDVRALSTMFSPDSIDAIITEPYLGLPNLQRYPPEKIKQEISKIEHLYVDTFRSFKKVLKQRGVIVIVFPLVYSRGQTYTLNILDQLQSLGFRIRGLNIVDTEEKLHLQISDRGSVVFYRPGQPISREIFVFEI